MYGGLIMPDPNPLDFRDCSEYALAVWNYKPSRQVNKDTFMQLYDFAFFSCTASPQEKDKERYILTIDYRVRVKHVNDTVSFISLGALFYSNQLLSLPLAIFSQLYDNTQETSALYQFSGWPSVITLYNHIASDTVESPLRSTCSLICKAIITFYDTHQKNFDRAYEQALRQQIMGSPAFQAEVPSHETNEAYMAEMEIFYLLWELAERYEAAFPDKGRIIKGRAVPAHQDETAALLREQGLFKEIHDNPLEQNRHNSPELQHEYDTRFGLTVPYI
jgi:hypothetical protein